MAENPFKQSDPQTILDLLYRQLESEQIVSLRFTGEARSTDLGTWDTLLQVLAQPAIYDAFGITSLPLHVEFKTSVGLETIGTLANLLNGGSANGQFVDDHEKRSTNHVDSWINSLPQDTTTLSPTAAVLPGVNGLLVNYHAGTAP